MTATTTYLPRHVLESINEQKLPSSHRTRSWDSPSKLEGFSRAPSHVPSLWLRSKGLLTHTTTFFNQSQTESPQGRSRAQGDHGRKVCCDQHGAPNSLPHGLIAPIIAYGLYMGFEPVTRTFVHMTVTLLWERFMRSELLQPLGTSCPTKVGHGIVSPDRAGRQDTSTVGPRCSKSVLGTAIRHRQTLDHAHDKHGIGLVETPE